MLSRLAFALTSASVFASLALVAPPARADVYLYGAHDASQCDGEIVQSFRSGPWVSALGLETCYLQFVDTPHPRPDGTVEWHRDAALGAALAGKVGQKIFFDRQPERNGVIVNPVFYFFR